jgi:hypothetical protein
MGRPANLSRRILDRVRCAVGEHEVTRHLSPNDGALPTVSPGENLTKPDISKPRSSSAERTRRYRDRLRKGALLLDIQMTGIGIDRLISGGWLDPKDRGDHTAVAKAIIGLADRALSVGIRPGPGKPHNPHT